jgi:hypothetical protein
MSRWMSLPARPALEISPTRVARADRPILGARSRAAVVQNGQAKGVIQETADFSFVRDHVIIPLLLRGARLSLHA